MQVTELSAIVTSRISLNCSREERSFMLLCADILASLDELTDVFGGSSQGSYNDPAVFASILIS